MNGETDGTVSVLGPRTFVTVGFAVMFLGAVATAAWKLSAISAKLDNIAMTLTEVSKSTNDTKDRLANHEKSDADERMAIRSQINVLQQSGSPHLQDVEKRLTELEVSLKVHERTADKKP